MLGSSNGSGCKKHPKHKQSPGVCFLCLSDELSRLSETGYALANAASSDIDASSSLSSSDISSCESSPVSPPVGSTSYNHHYRFLRRIILSETTTGHPNHCPEIKTQGKGKFWFNLFNIICPKRRTRMIQYQSDHVISRSHLPIVA